MEVPPLPATAFDPLALTDETADAVEGNLSALNGQASCHSSGGFMAMGVPQIAGWFLLGKNPMFEWMMTRGSPVSGTLQVMSWRFCRLEVIVNFATSAVEEFMIAKREREEYKAC